jgi:hypothetical protein
MAAEKKPRATKAETKTTKTTATKKVATTKAAATKPRVVRARKPKVAAVTGEHIAERAYYLWVEGSDGDAFAHWVQAERELTAA